MPSPHARRAQSGIEAARGPLASLGAAGSERTGFVGRRTELAAVSAELEHARLVTVTGPGGVGKSRLVREVARRAQDRLASRVVFVELEGVSDPSLVVEVVAEALGQRAASDVDAAVVRMLAGTETLLILDGCEHLVAGVHTLVEFLLRACPGLRMVTTSQQVLRLAGEHVIALGPLPVPGEQRLTPHALLAYGAAELFVVHARAACQDLVLDDSAAAAVARVCRHLDGLPLALELVAPMARVLSLEQLAAALEEGMLFSEDLTLGPARHRSMSAALAWSFALLSPGERRLLESLSVFTGGADVEALARVSSGASAPRREVVETLARLADKSLVAVTIGEGESVPRHDLLGVVRRHIQADLEQEGRLEGLARRHLAWCLDMVAGAEEGLISGPHQARWLDSLAREQGNIRAALGFALDVGDVTAAAALARDLWRFWELRGQLSEGRRWLERVLGAGQLPVDLKAHLLDGAGMLAWRQGDYKIATSVLEEALELLSDSGDQLEAARIGHHLGLVWLFAGKATLAERLFRQCISDLELLDSPGEAALVSTNLALVAIEEGCFDYARQLLDAALAIQVALGDRHGRAVSLLHRSIAHYYLGDSHCAREDAHEAARVFFKLGDERSLAFALLALAAALARRRPPLALELAGLAARLGEQVGVGLPAGWDARVESALAPARAALGAFAHELMRKGACMDPAVALIEAEALDEPSPTGEEPWGSVETLGRFQVRRYGRPVHLAPQAARLVKFVAAAGHPVPVEQVMETLWPEVEPGRGRRRLRNVLSRVHRAAGSIVAREGEALTLAKGVVLDAARFEAEADRALVLLTTGEPGSGARRQLQVAAGLYSGNFLPEDLYEPWTTSTRERLQRRWLRLVDVWASAALAEGDQAEAEQCLRAGIEADPTDEGRYLSLARLLADSGRPAAAAAVLSRARTMAAELGVPVSTGVTQLEGALGLRPPGS